ncbi:efflux RND transporter periplasmic adaptor subunit [Thetidibacter halocola]|uniref:Efflux RND transporter periplasmic adaptor subunit n=1 Tax=Thetidibacter halocola TaxID=2827239 RepID=A0A8J7WKE4_9RHOB|nr:efflux RND transporter periplasmic adaptor subunit [Thetidibacter halocola]MBS0126639.1 efflux RND transporter periplasmic adaptor subunit [Thetidibacter halocola]
MMRPALVLSLLLAAPPVFAQGYDCLMDPFETVELASPVAGLLDEVLVERGDVVTEGQLIARLSSEIEESTVDLLAIRANSTAVIDAQAQQVEMIRKRHDRIVQLQDRGIATQETLDQVETELIAAQSLLLQAELNRDLALKELARAKIALGQRTILSPVDGIVRARVMGAGEYVDADDHIVEIVQLDPLRVEAFVPVSLFGKLNVGQSGTVRPAEPIAGAYEARIVAIDPVFDAASATFVVVLELPNPERSLPAGHRCTLDIGGS